MKIFYHTLTILIGLSVSSLFLSPLHAQASPIIFIYDASGSMWGKIGTETKMQIARQVLIETIDQLPETQALGLLAYGHRQEGDCEDVEYLVEANNTSKLEITYQLSDIQPLGKTPLAASALTVIESLKNSGQSATIILLTDGVESCGGNLCDVIQAAREAGVDFKLHIVGFGLADEDLENLKCAARAGGGKYYSAADADELSTVLTEATATRVDKPNNNLAILSERNNEPIDAWVKVYESGTDTEVGGTRTYRDTGFVSLPPGEYDLFVQPLENSDVSAQTVKGVRITEGALQVQHLSFDAGVIRVLTTMNEEGWDATVGIKESSSQKNVAGGRTYGREKYYEVSPGTYDVLLKALVIRGMETSHTHTAISVAAGDTTSVLTDFKTGTARIGALGNEGLMDATINIVDKAANKSIGGSRTYTADSSNPKEFLLTPGEYTVTLISVREFKGEKRSFEMTIKAGETFEKMVQF